MKKQTDDIPINEVPDKEADEWKGKYLRALADYQNLEKRARIQVDEGREYAAEVILSQLLPVLDTFTKVKEHIKDTGFALAYKQLQGVLSEQGVEMMQVKGQPFDPHTMECIEVIEGPENIVMEELLPGFTFRGKILRVAQVKVGKQHIKN